jgi:hypothetical protein
VVCTVPADARATVQVQIQDRWIQGFTVTLPARRIVFRQMTFPLR